MHVVSQILSKNCGIDFRCHKRGLAGKLELAKQWVFEQTVAGGEVTFKEGLAFYSSIGILQVMRVGKHSF